MKLQPIAANQTELEKNDGTIIFYSYRTPVAAFVPGRGALCTKARYSATTTRHITKAVERWGCSRTDVEQGEIDRLADA